MNNSATLILLPGLDGTGRLFAPFLAALPPHIRAHVIAYPPDTPLSLIELAQHVQRQLPSGPLVLLAESFSGPVALTLLRSPVPSIEAVIFCSSFAESPRPLLLALSNLLPKPGWLMRFSREIPLRILCLGWGATGEQLALATAALAEVSPEVLAHRLALIAAARAPARAPCQVPCYYLQARRDRLVPAGAARWFKSSFRSFQLHEIEGPHFLLQAEPHECARRVAAICSEVANRPHEVPPVSPLAEGTRR